MALDDTQKMKVRIALREPLECQSAIDTYLARLNAATEAYLITLLAQWDTVANDTTVIKVDGVEIDNQSTANLLASRMSDCIGWTPTNQANVIMGRGFIEEYNQLGYQSQSVDAGWPYD
jgi:hypothetical protein